MTVEKLALETAKILEENPKALAFLLALEKWKRICDKYHDRNCRGCPLMPCHSAICDACFSHQGDYKATMGWEEALEKGLKPQFTWCPHYKKCLRMDPKNRTLDEFMEAGVRDE